MTDDELADRTRAAALAYLRASRKRNDARLAGRGADLAQAMEELQPAWQKWLLCIGLVNLRGTGREATTGVAT